MNNDTNQVEKIIEAKIDVILCIPSLERSLVLHLDAYYQILKLIESDNLELQSKIDKLIEKTLKTSI